MTDQDQQLPGKNSKRRIFILFLPLIIFGGLSVFFLLQLLSGRDIQVIPSVLIGKPAPALVLSAIEGSDVPGVDAGTLDGKVTLVNVWASWCGPCRIEHPFLMELAKDPRIQIVGLNYKDKAANALKFLSDLGNPYTAVGVDTNGEAAINWGVYGVPETFVLDTNGLIIYKHIGPIDAKAYSEKVLPAIEALFN